MQNELILKGFGEKYANDFNLDSFECLYLSYIKKLKITRARKNISFDDLLSHYKKVDDDIFKKFLVYRDIRNRGYIIKKGFGFGSDFLVYDKGHFGQKGAKYLIFALDEGTQEKIGKIQKNIDAITKMGKEPIIAVIERRGEVIYYKISKIDFLENRQNSKVVDFDF